MNNITKVSEITVLDLRDYLNIYEVLSSGEENTLSNMLNIAKAYIKNYTGVNDLDEHEDFVIVALCLVQDMWDNRALYVDKTNLNKVVETILDMHSINLLPRDEVTG